MKHSIKVGLFAVFATAITSVSSSAFAGYGSVDCQAITGEGQYLANLEYAEGSRENFLYMDLYIHNESGGTSYVLNCGPNSPGYLSCGQFPITLDPSKRILTVTWNQATEGSHTFSCKLNAW